MTPWPTRATVLVFDRLPFLGGNQHGVTVDVPPEPESPGDRQVPRPKQEVDYRQLEEDRIRQVLRKKMLEHEAKRVKQQNHEVETMRDRKCSESDEDDDNLLDIEMPDGEICMECGRTINKGCKRKFGKRDRKRNAECDGGCVARRIKRTGKCPVCRKRVDPGSTHRDVCNGRCVQLAMMHRVNRSRKKVNTRPPR